MGYTNDELRHFGVLGMKWGRRMARNSASSLRSEAKMLKEDAQFIRKWGKEDAAKRRVKNKKAEARVKKNAKWYDDAANQALVEARLREKKAKALDREIKLKEKSNAQQRAIRTAKVKTAAGKVGNVLGRIGNHLITGKENPTKKDYIVGLSEIGIATISMVAIGAYISKHP